LDYCEGDKRRAAAVLGCSLKTLYNKLNSYARERAERERAAIDRHPLPDVGASVPMTSVPMTG